MKEDIIDTSVRLFLNQGFKSVTMDDIANEMGISKKTIYTHFNTKTKLVEAAAFQLFDSTRIGMDAISDSAQNPIEELYSLKMYVMQQLKNETSTTQNQLKKYYFKIHETFKLMLCEKIYLSILASLEHGVASGVFKDTIDIDFISRMYYTGMTGIRDNMSFPPGKYKTHYLMENYLHYHLKAITTKKGEKMLNNLINTNES